MFKRSSFSNKNGHTGLMADYFSQKKQLRKSKTIPLFWSFNDGVAKHLLFILFSTLISNY